MQASLLQPAAAFPFIPSCFSPITKMCLSMKPARPGTFQTTTTRTIRPAQHVSVRCCTLTQPAVKPLKMSVQDQLIKCWEHLLDPIDYDPTASLFTSKAVRLGNKWKEYHGSQNWEGMLDPLDENLRFEILRYGNFVEAAYRSFNFDSSDSAFGACLYPKSTLLDRSGVHQTGYRVTKHLRATSGIQMPRWTEMGPNWVSSKSSWIGYVAVCQDKEEIARLGRRDVVIALRGTATGLEWLENFRANLTPFPEKPTHDDSDPMVETGFLSLYTSRTDDIPSLQEMVREEISRLLQTYGDEQLSITITGHSLGAALATLTAYDIKTNFERAPMVTVMSFGGPRVGNMSFRCELEKQGTKVLRIVNSDDLITKVPGFVLEDDSEVSKDRSVHVAGLPCWIQKRVEDTQWVYAEVGRELRLRSRNCPYIKNINVATCHDLKTYLHLVNYF